MERILYHGRDLTPLASVLAQLAYALDEHGTPINYARRRALFTGPETAMLDLDAYTRLRLQHGWSRSYAPRLAVLRWYLLMLLTGEHPAIPGTRKQLTSTGPPPATANGLPISPSRASTLSPARLRDLYERQNLPMTEIAAMAGCATVTIRRLLQIDGVPQRPAYRRPLPESGITREWLHRAYVVKLRSIDTIARERGVTAYYLMSLARNWGLPIRRHSDFSGIGHLNLPAPPSPAMRAVTMRTGALGRLELITRIPGHDSPAAAARVLYGGRDGALRQMIAKIETAAGFTIIDRSSMPLAPTGPGREFIQEALQILQAAPGRRSAGRLPRCPAGGYWPGARS